MEFPLFQDITSIVNPCVYSEAQLRVLFCRCIIIFCIYIYMHKDTVCTQHELCPMVVLRIPFFKQLDLDSAIPRLEEGGYAAQ